MSTSMSTSRSNYTDMSIWKKHADHSTIQGLHPLQMYIHVIAFDDVVKADRLSCSYHKGLASINQHGVFILTLKKILSIFIHCCGVTYTWF